jgi:aminopeptidase N
LTSSPTEKSHLTIAAAIAALIVAVAMLIAPAADAGKGNKEGKPRLVVSSLDSPPATAEAGTSFDVKGTVANRGKGDLPAGSEVSISLRNGSSNVSVGSAELKKIKGGKEKKFSATAKIPASLTSPAGDPLSLVACVLKQGTTGRSRCKTADGKIAVTAPVTPPPPGKTYTPGSRSLGDPYFPQIGNGGYDAQHYRIALDYDPATNTFADGSSTTITIKATQDLSEFSFDFQPDLTVSAVTLNGTPAASFAQVDATPVFDPDLPEATQPGKLVVTPAAGIDSGSTVDVKVSYSGTPKEIEDADESFEGWVRSCTFAGFVPPCDGAYTVNEPIGVQSWFPANNVPSDKATIETIPTTHVALGTGELQNRTDNGDGTWTWDWNEDDKTAPFLATATVGLFDYSNNLSLTENVTGRSIPIYKAIDSAKTATSKNNFNTYTAAIPNVMNYLSDTFGPYPFDSTGAVADVAPDVGYALENQTKPHYASSITSNGVGFNANTQVHELSHQWWGDAVSPADWSLIWFSEGWATFTENAYDPGPPAGEDTANLQDFFADIYSTPDDPGNGDTDWTLPPAELGEPSSTGPANLFNGFSVYDRPGAMIIGFRFIVGEEAFYEFANDLQDTYRYGNITEDQFIQAAEDASGFTGSDLSLLDEYFEQWLHSTSKPTITPDSFNGCRSATKRVC